MDKLAGLLSDIEQAIRYLFGGVVVVALFLMARSDAAALISWGQQNLALAVGVTGAIGVVSYSLYRSLWWSLGDFVAWKMGYSAPSLYTPPTPQLPTIHPPFTPHLFRPAIVPAKQCYSRPYSHFLRWRNSTKVISSHFSKYLFIRWAVAHLVMMVAFSCVIAACFRDPGSFVDAYVWGFLLFGLGCGVVASIQQRFLFRVEQELVRESKDSEGFDAFKEPFKKPDPLNPMTKAAT